MKVIKYRINCMGTLSIELKAKHMRKADDFTVYPISALDNYRKVQIQSCAYWAELDLDKNQIEFSSRHSFPGRAAFCLDQVLGKTKTYDLDPKLVEEIVEKIAETASPKAGRNGLIFSDNSGASNLKSYAQ